MKVASYIQHTCDNLMFKPFKMMFTVSLLFPMLSHTTDLMANEQTFAIDVIIEILQLADPEAVIQLLLQFVSGS